MNLQLFANYDPNSIVDYLKQNGQDSSMSARKEIAKNLGISNYKGSEEQNIQMLNTLKNGGKVNTKVETPKAKDKVVSKDVPAKAEPKVEETVVPKAEDPAVSASDINGVDTNTMQALTTPYAQSPAVQEAWNVTNAQKEKLLSGRTSYTDQIQSLMNQIQNREKFSYDVDTDMLFQQALASSMASGKQAMQDTIGQASALTGGYASTYAQSAGNQAYNAYIQDAYNNLPEYYQMALEAYNMEGQDMYNQLSMLNDADATEYERLYNAYSASFDYANNLQNFEYGTWQDTVNNAYNVANLQNSDYWSGMDEAYRRDALQQEADQFTIDNQYRYDALAQDDKWNTIDNKYRYDAMENSNTQADLDRKHDSSESALDRQHNSSEAEKDRLHDSSESEKDRQHDNAQFTAKYDINGDGKVDANDQKVEDETTSYKEPSESQKQKALEAYNTGGEDAYFQYLDSLPSNIDVDSIDAYVNGDGEENKGYGELPLEKRTFTKTKDTTNWFWGVDNNDVVEDQYGNTYRIDELPESIRKALTKLGKGESYTAK